MIESNQKVFNRIRVLFDALIVIISYVAAWFLRFRTSIFRVNPYYFDFQTYMLMLLGVIPLYLLLYLAFHLYTPKRGQGRRGEIWNILSANIVAFLVIMGLLFLFHQANFSRIMLVLFVLINIFCELLFRHIMRYFLARIRKKGYNHKKMLIIGYSQAAEMFMDRILQNTHWGYSIIGILADNIDVGATYGVVPVIASTQALEAQIEAHGPDEIVIALGLEEYGKLPDIVKICEKSGVHTKFIPDYMNVLPTKPYIENIQGVPVINIRHVPLSNTLNWALKRGMDILGAMVALILFGPLMLVIAFFVKLSPGPVLYRQERVGLANRPFSMYKFRSMIPQDASTEQKQWTVKNDPRVTRFGHFIRGTSLDELPQLFNVLKGEMSLVGPRPERPQFVEIFKEDIPRYLIKHQIRPGITGWAQINGYRGDTSIKKRIECDLYYIENWSIALDIKIILLTFVRGFINRNAY